VSFLSAPYLRVVSSERYETNDGEVRYHRTEVGRAFWQEGKNGERYLTLKIFSGISVTGNLAVFEPKPKDERESALGADDPPSKPPEGAPPAGTRGQKRAANRKAASDDDIPI
jgi:hypothetical protein